MSRPRTAYDRGTQMHYPFTSDKDRTIDDGVTMVDVPSAGGASAAARKVFAPGDRVNFFGFRLCCSTQP